MLWCLRFQIHKSGLLEISNPILKNHFYQEVRPFWLYSSWNIWTQWRSWYMAWQNDLVEWPTFHWVLTQPLSSMEWLNSVFILAGQLSVFLSPPFLLLGALMLCHHNVGLRVIHTKAHIVDHHATHFRKYSCFSFVHINVSMHVYKVVWFWLCKQTTTRKVKDWTGAFWVTKHWPWSSWYRKTVSFKSIPLVSVCLFVDQTVGRDLSDMREEAGLFRNLHLSYHFFSPHQCRWTTKAGMDERHHLLKQQVTVSISTSPCIPFPFPSPSPLLPPPILQVVLVTAMAQRLISVTGQWASDCQLNWLCILVGSLRIEAHSLWLTGLQREALKGVSPPPLLSCAKK